MDTITHERPACLTCAETAKHVRTALKRAFPGVKFSVRSKTYSGGASINVGWRLGPTTKEVDAVTAGYAGSGFDGMIDLKYSCVSWLLPDGSATFAHSSGTTGSMGMDEPYNNPKPHPDAKMVQFLADSVSSCRSFPDNLSERIGRDLCELQHVKWNDAQGLGLHGLCGAGDRDDLHRHAWRLLARTSFAPGEEYAGVQYAPENHDVGRWVDVVKTK